MKNKCNNIIYKQVKINIKMMEHQNYFIKQPYYLIISKN